MRMTIKENILLAPYTTFKIGGPARYFCEVKSKEELKEAVSWANKKNAPIFVLGAGSNVLVSDSGFSGLAIKNEIIGMDVFEEKGHVRVTVGAGEEWDKFVEFAVSRNLAGVECLSGIPGKVGAAPVQNIGAYGQSASETIESVRVLDLKTNEEALFQKDDCEFGYRTSKFKKNPGQCAITSVSFALRPDGIPRLTYHELKNYFAENHNPTLFEARDAVLKIRSKKGMVAKGEELHSSVGSFFTNPVISKEKLEDLKPLVDKCRTTKNCCADPWFWLRPDGRTKISAACLIECAGFNRGLKRDSVGISSLHSLALINYGGASAEEALAFSGEIQNKIQEKFDVFLEIEPQLVGF